jgi:hypothetical protein
VWAAGHIEKSREVTTSGPYQFTRHPLYAGSAVLAIGVVVAARSPTLGLLTALYLGATMWAAIQTEEAFLRRTFGAAYDSYRRSARRASVLAPGQSAAPRRRFSMHRAWRNREYRAVAGLGIGFGLLAMRVLLPL